MNPYVYDYAGEHPAYVPPTLRSRAREAIALVQLAGICAFWLVVAIAFVALDTIWHWHATLEKRCAWNSSSTRVKPRYSGPTVVSE